MSLIEKPPKEPIVYKGGRKKIIKPEEQIAEEKAKKKAYQEVYQKQYQAKTREKDPDHFRNMGKKSYYKLKYGMESELVDLYGEYCGDVFKLRKTFRSIIEKQPQLKTHLIEFLSKDPSEFSENPPNNI